MADIPVKKAYAEKTPMKPELQRWWLADKDLVHDHLVALVKLIEENQKEQRLQDVRHAYLYNNHQSTSPLPSSHAELPQRYHVTYNVVKSAIDTVTARISQRELRPRVLTEKGNYAEQQRAKKLTKYLDGLLSTKMVYREGPQVLKDAGIFGTGVMKVTPDYECGEVRFERCHIQELLVDDLEARYGAPQSLYQIRLVSKDRLAEEFPKQAMAIMNASTTRTDRDDDGFEHGQAVEMVKVYEGWHIGKHGRHVIAIEGCTLWDKPWKHDCFPFAMMRYLPKSDSFYGQGIAEELLGTQLEINKLLRDIQRAQHLIAVPRILLERHSKVIPAHLNNEIGSAIKYEGTKPDFINPTAMNNEVYNHVKWLVQSAYEKVGVSILSATSKKPAGLDSRPALREFSNIESERFAITEMGYQNFFQDVAQLAVKWSKELYKAGVNPEVKAESRKFIESIKWSDVDLEDSKFTTRMYISSLLPMSPSARLQKIEEYVRSGWMDRETALQQFNHPDVESWETLETADKDFVESVLSDILEKGEYRAPEPEIDPTRAVNLARKVYLEALRTKAPSDRLELLLRWIEAASSLLPELATPAAPSLGEPAATPQQLPESGLLPQV